MDDGELHLETRLDVVLARSSRTDFLFSPGYCGVAACGTRPDKEATGGKGGTEWLVVKLEGLYTCCWKEAGGFGWRSFPCWSLSRCPINLRDKNGNAMEKNIAAGSSPLAGWWVVEKR